MSTQKPLHPIDEARRLGTVIAATPGSVTVNLPNASKVGPLVHHGEQVHRGLVGEYVCFARQDVVILGRITRVQLPERDRLSVEPRIGAEGSSDPLGTVSLLTDIDLVEGRVTGVVVTPPKLGVAAYSVPQAFLRWVLEVGVGQGGKDEAIALCLGEIAGPGRMRVRVTPERIFGRHCAVLGTTGSGKSWTLARLIEECARLRAKVVLLDATGEFCDLVDGVQHYSLGIRKDGPAASREVSCPHDRLEERDLFALFTPAAQAQAPILREAIRSLRLAKCVGKAPLVEKNGTIVKEGKQKAPFETAMATHTQKVHGLSAPFDIEVLGLQINQECVWASSKINAGSWGGVEEKALGLCTSLVMRIEGLLNQPAFAPMFNSQHLPVQDAIDQFLTSDDPVMRLSLRFLEDVQFLRSVVANAIGRHILFLARQNRFRTQPTVVVIDEAHQFLGKSIGLDELAFPLDAFDILAKEGRKYGVTVCIATQRPRDIQDGVLSQIGTMIVHRLTHGGDREVVERAARDVERSVAEFLPALGPGQALLIGTDFPIPIPIAVTPPTKKPVSDGPNYQQHWRPTGAQPAQGSAAPPANPAPAPASKRQLTEEEQKELDDFLS
ncbi:MAG: ATP-binding protein [Planctomycetes bacterium]|nr:ATP-binding protein [Planctomycetota bacterium]MCC7062101.1 ATP-binding protein [Planctomycetota bacterium]